MILISTFNSKIKLYDSMKIQTLLFIVGMISLVASLLATHHAFGQSVPNLTRYNTECGVAADLDIDILKGIMVIQFGGTNTNKWDDREAAEKFNCIEAIEYQEKMGINEPIVK